MNYPIPANPQEIVALRQKPVNEELVAAAIAGVVQIARQQGQSLADLTAELLAEDGWLDHTQRRWLSDIVTQAWESLPPAGLSSSCLNSVKT
jgi:hypothetical protein